MRLLLDGGGQRAVDRGAEGKAPPRRRDRPRSLGRRLTPPPDSIPAGGGLPAWLSRRQSTAGLPAATLFPPFWAGNFTWQSPYRSGGGAPEFLACVAAASS